MAGIDVMVLSGMWIVLATTVIIAGSIAWLSGFVRRSRKRMASGAAVIALGMTGLALTVAVYDGVDSYWFGLPASTAIAFFVLAVHWKTAEDRGAPLQGLADQERF